MLASEDGRFELPVPHGATFELVARRTRHLSSASGNLHFAEFAVGRHIAPTEEHEARLGNIEPGARQVELRLGD